MARDLRLMCYQAQILLVAVHQPGKVNVRADRLSPSKHNHTTNIQLNPKVVSMINQR